MNTPKPQPAEPTPFENFEELARKVFTTPKTAVEKTEAEERAEKGEAKKKQKGRD
jgi:hypothetical protein